MTVRAKDAFKDTTDLVVTVTNGHGTTTKTYGLSQARMSVARTVHDNVPAAGATLMLDLDCNVNADLYVDEADVEMMDVGMTGNEADGMRMCLIVKKNPDMQPRSGVLHIEDADGVLPEIKVTVNQMASAIPSVLTSETDKQALMVIVDALHMDKSIYPFDLPFNFGAWNYKGASSIFTGISEDRVGYLAFGGSDYGVFPDELGWLDQLKWIECSTPDKDCPEGGIHGPLPKTLGGCKSLTRLDLWGTHICEKLNDSPIRDVISHVRELTLGIDHYGTFPEWLAYMPENGEITSMPTHLSGQIPDRVVNMKPMAEGLLTYRNANNEIVYPSGCECFIAKAKSCFNYALWIGEQPSNVKFVSDEHDGHWEWTDTVFDKETQMWKHENDVYAAGNAWITPRK